MTTIRTEQYKYVNYVLLFSFAMILVYPLFVHITGVDIKSCNLNCPSCGITTDIYNLLTFQTHGQVLNQKSYTFFGLVLSLIVSRLLFSQLLFYDFRKTLFADIIITSTIFILIFFLINKF